MKMTQAPRTGASSMSHDVETLPRLIDTLQDGTFWTIDFETQILQMIKREFATELDHLKRAKADKKGVPPKYQRSYGRLLFGEEDGEKAYEYYEIDRTLTAVHALRWIQDPSPEASKRFNPQLSPSSWSWIRDRFTKDGLDIFSPDYAAEAHALITSVVINDVGKDPELPALYRAKTGDIETEHMNHDMWLDKAIAADMIPCVRNVRPDLWKDIMFGVHIAAESNLGQLAQAENVPASLYPLTRFRQNVKAWRLRILEQILDLAGAHGHFDNSYARIFGEAVAHGNRSAWHVVQSMIFPGEDGRCKTPREGWDDNLLQRYQLIKEKGYARQLEFDNKRDRALMRFFAIGGVQSLEIASLYEHVLLESPHTASIRDELIDLLNKDGIEEPAVQMTYMPAMCSGALAHFSQGTIDEKHVALAAVFHYILKVHRMTDEKIKEWRAKGVTVVERDVFDVNRDYVKTDKFVKDPWGLLQMEIPSSGVANTVETSHES